MTKGTIREWSTGPPSNPYFVETAIKFSSPADFKPDSYSKNFQFFTPVRNPDLIFILVSFCSIFQQRCYSIFFQPKPFPPVRIQFFRGINILKGFLSFRSTLVNKKKIATGKEILCLEMKIGLGVAAGRENILLGQVQVWSLFESQPDSIIEYFKLDRALAFALLIQQQLFDSRQSQEL